MIKAYKTVLNLGTAEIEEKKSRFIATVKPVTSEDEALEFINGLKSKYWDATHNVYSYYIGGNITVQRFSDDGEPSGTAGMPVLEVIRRMGVQDLAVVVTRYFGGTLLGASGLIRAYSKAAALGIEAARVIRRQLCTEVSVLTEYPLFGKVQNMLVNEGYTIKEIVYEQDVEIRLYVPVDGVEECLKKIVEETNDQVLIETGDNVFITVDEDGKLIKE
ncbi:YigZ family protein [Clostridium thermosuccinogenes]|uniref:YigZ family protein n=1 Tax=Clostridium thermosuccinogenes TaxID=84032 RepID=UPI000CCC6426|nr:YigZ family protein [Pseudoclostridium thermosuccinogenes]PNT91594.1 YigZ family protein [Pseudoclostridium thermosuccinogenes]